MFLDSVNAAKDVFQLLVKEVFHVLGMRLDLDDNVAVMLFQLRKGEGPIGLHQFFLIGLYRLKEHIGLVVDLVCSQKFLKGFFQVPVLQIALIKYTVIGFSNQIRRLQEQHEI